MSSMDIACKPKIEIEERIFAVILKFFENLLKGTNSNLLMQNGKISKIFAKFKPPGLNG